MFPIKHIGSRLTFQLRITALESLCILLTLLEKRNSGDVFDYSATQLLAEWIKSAISPVPALSSVTSQLDSLARTVALETGKAQAQIWTMFRDGSDGLFDGQDALLERLNSIVDHKLKISIAQAIAAVRTGDEEEFDALKQMIQSFEPGPENAAPTKWTLRSLLGPIELEALARGSEEAVQLLLLDKQLSPLTGSILLSAAKPSARPAVFFQAMSGIMNTLWNAGKLDSPHATGEGVSKLFTPGRLESVLRFSGHSAVTLQDLSQEQDGFKFTIDMVLWSTKHTIDSRSALLDTLGRTIGMLCTTFGSQIDPTGYLPSLVHTTASLPDSILKDSLQRFILPHIAQGGLKTLATIGKAWAGLSRLLIELYVTNIPIDPAVRRVLLGDVISSRLALLEEELSVVEHAEIDHKGISDSLRRSDLLARIQVVTAEKDNLGPTVDRSTDASRLAILFNEVHSFIDDAFSPSAFDGLLQALDAGHPQALLREEGFQISSAAFIARLSHYSDLEDLVTPIKFAVESAKLGISILARDLELKGKSSSTSVQDAMRFPISSAMSAFAQLEPSSQMTKAALRDQFLAATALSADAVTLNQRIRHVPRLVDTFDQLYLSWSEIRQREQQDDQASESLYRIKKTDIEVLSDEELEEQEFARMFPTYEEDSEDPIETPAPAVADEKVRFDSGAVLSFHKLLMSAFGSTKTSIDFRSAIDKVLASDFEPSAYDELVDNSTLPLQIRHLHERMLSLQPSKSHPNFYTEANEPEVRKARALILRLIARLDQLIEDWPEQMVPQHIKDRCEAILLLHTRSPVARVLTSLEQLLLHTNDWEGYANKENSLASYQAELSDQIVSWRRLELSSWMRLLDDQVIEYSNNDAEWTMRLFGALVQGVQLAEDVGKHLETTLPMISSYLSASSLGHFASRVEALRALANMADEMVSIDAESRFKQTSALLHNIVANASLFLPRLNDQLHTQRAIIDKAIKDFVKLASWKDVNVYALKASAVKSHRQLHRNVRKFREVLRQPVAPILMDHNSICPQESATSVPQGTIPPVFTITPLPTAVLEARATVEPAPPAHLVRLEDTLKRYHSVHEKARSTMTAYGADGLDMMAVEIIETAAELAKATPESLTKENTKLVNNLASRKRKAYSDLLKALRASGFSNSVRADQLAKQQSSTSMSTLARLPTLPDGLDNTDINKVESYHHRLNVLMITLRAAFNGHNPDIASQDLERGIGYAESVFAAALVERQRFVFHLPL
jgi:midasin